MNGDMTEYGWFAPGLESLPPGLMASGVVYAIHCSKVDSNWIKVGSVNIDRVSENLHREIYNQQNKYLFVLEAVLHVAVENEIHMALHSSAHPKHRDCFSLNPWDLLQECVKMVKCANEKALRVCAESFLASERMSFQKQLVNYENREKVFLAQIECLLPLLAKLVKNETAHT